MDALLAQIKAAEKALDGQGNLSSQENTHSPQEQLLPEESQEAPPHSMLLGQKTYEKARLLRSVPKGSLPCSTSLKRHSLELWQIATRS